MVTQSRWQGIQSWQLDSTTRNMYLPPYLFVCWFFEIGLQELHLCVFVFIYIFEELYNQLLFVQVYIIIIIIIIIIIFYLRAG